MTEEDYRYKMVATITRLETKLDGVQEYLDGLGKRVDVLDSECVRRGAIWSVLIILATLFSGVFATYYANHASIQASNATIEGQSQQQAALQEQLKKLTEASEQNRQALETWFRQNAKSR